MLTILVSNTILQTKEPELLLGLGNEIYKRILEHPVVSENNKVFNYNYNHNDRSISKRHRS